jgi:DNA polymerase I
MAGAVLFDIPPLPQEAPPVSRSTGRRGGDRASPLTIVYRELLSRVPDDALRWAKAGRRDLLTEIDTAWQALDDADPENPPAAPLQALAAAYGRLVNAWQHDEPHPSRVAEVIRETPETRYEVITTPTGLETIRRDLESAPLLGLDLETTGLNPRTDRTRLLSLSDGQRTFLVDCFQVDPRPLFPLLADRTLTGHNLLFDLSFLWALGFEPGPVDDTILRVRLLSAGLKPEDGYHALNSVVERTLGLTLSKELQKSDWSGELSCEQLDYAARDAAVLLPLREKLQDEMTALDLERVAAIENRCLPAVVWMSMAGVGFDVAAWQRLHAQAVAEADALRGQMDALCPRTDSLFAEYSGRDWDSPKQVTETFASLGLDVDTTCDAQLALLDHPVAALLRSYRSAMKRCSSYGEEWIQKTVNGRLFPGWQQIFPASGRMSCRRPNAQQVKREDAYRACFWAPEGHLLVKADYSQIELRLAAKIAREQKMQAAYREGKDLHTVTAQMILGKDDVTKADRQIAKSLNFGLLYGMGAPNLRVFSKMTYGVEMTAEEATGYRDRWMATYPAVQRWHRSQGRGGGDTRTLAGRRRLHVERYTERLNTPVQGSGADGLKQALALLWERRGDCPGAFPVLACHDEIVVECDAADQQVAALWVEAAMVDGMQEYTDPVPVEVEASTGRTWAG